MHSLRSTNLSSFAGLSQSQPTWNFFRITTEDKKQILANADATINIQTENRAKDKLKVRSKHDGPSPAGTSPFIVWYGSLCWVLHCSSCLDIFIRWLHTVPIWWEHRKAGKYVMWWDGSKFSMQSLHNHQDVRKSWPHGKLCQECSHPGASNSSGI